MKRRAIPGLVFSWYTVNSPNNELDGVEQSHKGNPKVRESSNPGNASKNPDVQGKYRCFSRPHGRTYDEENSEVELDEYGGYCGEWDIPGMLRCALLTYYKIISHLGVSIMLQIPTGIGQSPVCDASSVSEDAEHC